jgi:hypothetical protein
MPTWFPSFAGGLVPALALLAVTVPFVLKRMVDAAVHVGLEKAKAQFRDDTERLKAELRDESEQQKAELKADAERLKAALEADIVKARLGAGRLDRTLPKLLYLIRRAEGAVVRLLGIGWSADYTDYDLDDLEDLLKRLRVAGQERKETLELLAYNRDGGIRQVQRLHRRREVEEARQWTEKLGNFLLVETLFIPKPIRNAAWEIRKKLSEAWGVVYVGDRHPTGIEVTKHRELTKASAVEIEALQDVMQNALEPTPWDSQKPG